MWTKHPRRPLEALRPRDFEKTSKRLFSKAFNRSPKIPRTWTSMMRPLRPFTYSIYLLGPRIRPLPASRGCQRFYRPSCHCLRTPCPGIRMKCASSHTHTRWRDKRQVKRPSTCTWAPLADVRWGASKSAFIIFYSLSGLQHEEDLWQLRYPWLQQASKELQRGV